MILGCGWLIFVQLKWQGLSLQCGQHLAFPSLIKTDERKWIGFQRNDVALQRRAYQMLGTIYQIQKALLLRLVCHEEYLGLCFLDYGCEHRVQ